MAALMKRGRFTTFLYTLGRTILVHGAALIPAGGGSKRYVADSNNGRSLVKGDLHGRAFAKTAAATDLMQKLIPDVEEWLRQTPGS